MSLLFIGKVFFFGWLTALAAGVGALPFLCLTRPTKIIVGGANAVASGMMMSASVGLLVHGAQSVADGPSPALLTLIGASVGWACIILAKRATEGVSVESSLGFGASVDAKKMLLVIFVMTLHSFAEGVAIGVSFSATKSLGELISLSLAIHNAPEVLAIALVMVPRGVSVLDACLWAVFSSLPQPLMAVPAFDFVESFAPFLPVGLGFAAGAMLYVAFFELFPDAAKDLDLPVACAAVAGAFGGMSLIQWELNGVM